MAAAYYNEYDPYAAAWLRNLVAWGLIAPGDVDERSIVDVHPDDLRGYTQCHFFAGAGGWSLALRMAGWDDDCAVWSGSCPCQPFSSAGLQLGTEDERHLWPHFKRLIAECRPSVVFGEQVASRLGRGWLSGVRADLEALGYAVGAADLCAACVGAPHIRQRLWWVAGSDEQRPGINAKAVQARELEFGGDCGGMADDGGGAGRGWAGDSERGVGTGAVFVGAEESGRCGGAGGVADADGWFAGNGELQRGREHGQQPQDGGVGGGLGDASGEGLAERGSYGRIQRETLGAYSRETALSAGNPWSNAIWLPCADGKARRIEPGIEPLAHGVSGRVAVVRTRIEAGAEIQETHWYNRVGALRGFGNAIVPEVAEAFIRAYIKSA